MWNIESTTRLLKEMSQSTEPGELVRMFFDHVRQYVDVQRALVLSSAGLSPPRYRLVHDISCNDGASGSIATIDKLRQGGLLAKLLYRGTFHTIAQLASDPSDPDSDLFQGCGSLMAFPLFEKGAATGMVVFLASIPRVHNAADLCALATISSLLGRAIATQKLADQLEATCRALDSELKAAADVQRWLLPSLPALGGIDVAASYRTARRSGGDYYDVGRLPDGRIGVLIADVSGKGAAAAVLMAILRSIVHDEVDGIRLPGPASLLDHADRRLCALGLCDHGAFVTAFCGVLNPATGELTYSNAGHNPPRVLRAADRTVTLLDRASTFPLGLLGEPATHIEETVVLKPGDLALFYTDGITEARSPVGEFFGDQRLDQLLRTLPHPVTAGPVIEAIAQAVGRFAGDEPQTDDQTLLALGGCSN